MDESQKLFVRRTEFEIDRHVAELATRQHGVVARRQLLALEMSESTITRWMRARRLDPLYAGVYAVGHADLSRAGYRMAAVLACGKTASLSHRTAAHQWNLIDPPSGLIDVTLAAHSKPKLEGIRPHLSRLAPDETAERDNIPTTSLARTIVDLSSTKMSDVRLHVVLAAADREGLDFADLRSLVGRHATRHGVPRLRRVIAADQLVGLPASDLEIQFLEFLADRRLPLPQLNQSIHLNGVWIRPDCMWRRQKVLAEVDSKKHHDNWSQHQSDMARHTALAALGWVTVHVTARALAEGRALERDLRALLL
jgi:very-short-patch-repair endonuclease